MILLLLQWYFYYCNNTSTNDTISMIPQLPRLLTVNVFLAVLWYAPNMCVICAAIRLHANCHTKSIVMVSTYYTVLITQSIGMYHRILHQRWRRVLWELAGRADISILCWTQCHIHITSLYSAQLCSHVDTSILCSALLCSHVDISILCSGADDELLTAAAADSHWHCKQ